jgi:hypothetical protein
MFLSNPRSDAELLSKIKIATPCTADWDKMTGDERTRFCGQCKLNVYNISEMSTGEAASLIRKNEGRVCVRLFRRQDGTIITDNCPVGLRKLRERIRKVAAAVGIQLALTAFLSSQAHACDTLGEPVNTTKYEMSVGGVQSISVKQNFMDQYGFLINAAGVLSSVGILVLTLLKKTRPSTIGLMLLSIWGFTGFLIGVLNAHYNWGFIPPL